MIDVLWWILGTEAVGTFFVGSAFISGPIRLPTYIQMRHKGFERHEFRPVVIRDIHGKRDGSYCQTCRAFKGNWIHLRNDDGDVSVYDPENDAVVRANKIANMEAENVKWRFANDPEWVEVFGAEYDPETYRPIPQFHNGECGGPHDSCDLCNYEADKREAAEAKEREALCRAEQKKLQGKRDQEAEARKAKVKEYQDMLWSVWNTIPGPERANDEWEDIRDDILGEPDDNLRVTLKKSDIFKRLDYCLGPNMDTRHARWPIRERIWARKTQSSRRDND